ncbi:MAG: hypothetical protein ACKPJD_15935, partial [Planctomycetaceae bacterium]
MVDPSSQQPPQRNSDPPAAATQVISNLPQLSLGSLFKGRRETLQDLHRTLVRRAANKAVITANQTIAGLGGVGKTRLTLE